jgi:ribosomal-protein-alanine N-acetyltransferase
MDGYRAPADAAWMVRQATLADEHQVKQLIGKAKRVMLRFSADSLAGYLIREPFLLAEEAGRLTGFLAFVITRHSHAPLLAAGLADDWSIALWLDRLLAHCVTYLRACEITSLSYVGSAAWLTEPLQGLGFHLLSHIVAYEKLNPMVPQLGNQTVVVRPVRPEDLPALLALDTLAFHPLWRNSVGTLGGWMQTLPYFVVAVAREEPVGYCYCSMEGTGHGHLIRMAVHPAWQGQGFGARLVVEAMSFFRQVGARRITLNTQEENEPARRLYRKFGFRLVGREAAALWRDL